MEKETSQEERLSFEDYRPMALAVGALQSGDTQKAIGALEIMLQNFGTATTESKLLAQQLANDSQTTMQNYLPGYQQLHKKTVAEVASEIHGNFLKDKLGDQYEAFQADMKNYSGMTYGDLLKDNKRLANLQKMVKDGTATKKDEKEIEKLEKSINVYTAISSAEEVELQKIDNQIGNNTIDSVYESIRNSYKEKTAKAEKK
jgi:hypothetical protein